MAVIQSAPALPDVYPRVVAGTGTADSRTVTGRDAIRLSVHDDLASIESEWRAFEKEADCTVFQTFFWHSAWMRNVAPHMAVKPVIVFGHDADGKLAFIAPLAIHRRGFLRVLTWLATDLCDYNAPLLRHDFSTHHPEVAFPALWNSILALLDRDPRYRPDAVVFEKMPPHVGGQMNPFLLLPHSFNPNGAHETHLVGDWEAFYRGRRSSATRRHDRTKRKRLGEFGEVVLTTPPVAETSAEILPLLYAQKVCAFERMGVRNLFGRPGYAAFFHDLASDPTNGDLVHVSRLDVGGKQAAANFGLIFKGRFYHVLASYDDGPMAKYGPGATHLLDVMRHAIERGCDTFDFTIGDEPYKRNWSDRFVRLYDHRSIRTWRGLLVTIPAAATAHFKRVVKQSPRLWNLALRLRAAIYGRGTQAPAESEG